MLRTPDALILAVIRVDVRNNSAFLPHVRAIPVRVNHAPDVYVRGQPLELLPVTMCNTAASALLAILDAYLPPTLTATEQKRWLEGDDGKREGWRPCTAGEGLSRVNRGFPVTAVAEGELPAGVTDESKRGHGHIAVGVPNPADPTQLYFTAAGAANVTRAKLADTFGPLAGKALLFTHD